MKEKLDANKKDNAIDKIALQEVKARVDRFRTTKPVHQFYCKKRKLFVETTCPEKYALDK